MNEQIQNIIADSNNILIVSDKTARPEVFLAREALRLFLGGSGKRVLSYPELPDYFLEKFKPILPGRNENNFSYSTVISVPKLARIEEVCYEEDGSNFSIIVNSKSKLDRESISVKEKPVKIDVLFLFASEPEIQNLPSNFEIPGRERRINIVKSDVTVSKKIFDIAEKLNVNPLHQRQFATLLYAALIFETKNFRNIASAEVFDLAKNLLNFGASEEKISEIFNLVKSLPFSRVLGRALARTHIDGATSSSWTFIIREDIEKSGLKSSDFTPEALIDSIRDNVPETKVSLVFFEEPSGVRCFAESQDEQIILKLVRSFQQTADGNKVYSAKFENFTEAEAALKELLREI